jgi:DNA polymerase-3 subunit epsilon
VGAAIKLGAWLAFLATVLLAFGTIGATIWAVWIELDPQQQDVLTALWFKHAGILVVGGIILAVAIGFVVNLMFRWYVAPIGAIAEEIRIIALSNAGHRLAVEGKSEIVDLSSSINTLADRYQAVQEDVEKSIRTANAALEEERNTLAALMSNLTQGVLVCNPDGRILLYNQRARALLEGSGERRGGGDWIGLGRSVYRVLDEYRIAHALHNIDHHLRLGETELMAPFVAARPGGRLLSVHLVPVLDGEGSVRGYVLTLEDVTHRVGTESRRGALLKSVTEGHRSALAGIRAAIETVLHYPEMDDAGRHEFLVAIRDEALKMSEHTETLEREIAHDVKVHWTFREILGSDLLATLERQLLEERGIDAEISAPVEPLWLKVDGYALGQSLLFLVDQLVQACGAQGLSLTLERRRALASMVLEWSGKPLHMEALKSWGTRNVTRDGDGTSSTLFEVIENHGGAIWAHGISPSGRPRLRLILPVSAGDPLNTDNQRNGGFSHDFDFRLFDKAVGSENLETLSLGRLTCTVFDTETTGLNPREGDEIIAIGAVRIVNGRVLHREIFDELINPRQRISEASQVIHGISQEMLRGRPTIHDVLPRFHRFVEDTVLIGHNVAFDMRFLELKQASTGITFPNPVLDTLALASVVHPEQQERSLEAIAGRLGITVTGRHTALGDALTTAEVFLAMLPLLAERGIHTLSEAMAASERTPIARLKY